MASVGGALVLGVLSLSMANDQRLLVPMPLRHSSAYIFANAVRDDAAILGESSDVSALGYARSKRSSTPDVRWLPQPLPAVDGINGKIAGFGGGADHTSGFYGANGSLAFP